MDIQGECADEFSAVRAAFEENFATRGEVGASVCVMVGGAAVVDLWAGFADPETGRAWDRDTISQVWSSSKGAVALCAAILVDRDLLDLDEKVCTYWPEFARHGKHDVTVRMALTHQAGVPHVRAPVPEGGLRDWDLMVELIGDETPFWRPGTRQSYHALTFGWLIGEIVRRIDGRSLGRFFADEVARPFDVDLTFGLAATEHHRVAANRAAPLPDPDAPMTEFQRVVIEQPDSPNALILTNNGGFVAGPNLPEYWQAEIPAANGLTNGRGLARMYSVLAGGGTSAGQRILETSTVQLMGTTASASDYDGSLLIPMAFGLGFMKSAYVRHAQPEDAAVVSSAAFGHAGFGGSFGFADPVEGLSFGYTMNQQGSMMLLDGRGQGLVDATYRSLGYTSRSRGIWTR